MKYRKLGRTGMAVSEIGYGAWGIGQKQWLGGTDGESVAALKRAIEMGVNLIDTALAYGDGHSEQLVGQVVRETSQKIYVATKVPPRNRVWPARAGTPISEVFPYSYIVECAEESLRNLGLDSIDLLQLHVWHPEFLAADDWRRAFEDLKRSGKVHSVGISVSEHDPDSVLDALRTGLIDAVQVIYNVFDQSPEASLFPLCAEKNVGVLARVPLDEGALSGAITETDEIPGGRLPRILLPRRSQEAGGRARQRAEARPGPRRRPVARSGAAILPGGSRGLHCHPRNAHREARRREQQIAGPRAAARRDSGHLEAPRMGPELL